MRTHGEGEGVLVGKVWGGGLGDDGRVVVGERVQLVHDVGTGKLACSRGGQTERIPLLMLQ